MATVAELKNFIETMTFRSAWHRGVQMYALDILDQFSDETILRNNYLLTETLLNGAGNWKQYSEGGCSCVYDGDIAKRLCTPAELKKLVEGSRSRISTKTG